MQSLKYCIVLVAFIVLLTGSAEAGFLSILKTNRGDGSGCERLVQSSKYQCNQSSGDCRACCHFDLERMNDRYNDRFYIKESVLLKASNECICILCTKHTEDFNNKLNF